MVKQIIQFLRKLSKLLFWLSAKLARMAKQLEERKWIARIAQCRNAPYNPDWKPSSKHWRPNGKTIKKDTGKP
jgi:hypothetical protein